MTVTTITANLDWLEGIGTLESREQIKPDLYVWSVGGLSLWLSRNQLILLQDRINELVK